MRLGDGPAHFSSSPARLRTVGLTERVDVNEDRRRAGRRRRLPLRLQRMEIGDGRNIAFRHDRKRAGSGHSERHLAETLLRNEPWRKHRDMLFGSIH